MRNLVILKGTLGPLSAIPVFDKHPQAVSDDDYRPFKVQFVICMDTGKLYRNGREVFVRENDA